MNQRSNLRKIFPRMLSLLFVLALLLTAVSCDQKSDATNGSLKGYTNTEEVTDLVRLNITYTAKTGSEVTGDVVVRLRADIAPITVANFQKLVSEDFYDGLTFHRVVKGFMIQGGDPDGNGSGGSAQTIKGEFAANGVQNTLSHDRSVISMARSQSYNSASSQFFIMHANNAGLDGQYAAFGYVVYGMDTVDGIAETQVTYSASGKKSAPVNPVKLNFACFVTDDNAKETTPAATTTPAETLTPAEPLVSPMPSNYVTTEEVTELVRLNISYTDQTGRACTGDVIVRLRPDIAPITVANFQKLVSEDFYNGLTFHRVIKDFMIQGGAPDGAGSAQTIKGEFSENGVENPLHHERGVISMARSQEADSASSQFFIMHKTNEELDGKYAAFGSVVFGMETVDGIASTPVTYSAFYELNSPIHKVTLNFAEFVTDTTEENTDTSVPSEENTAA